MNLIRPLYILVLVLLTFAQAAKDRLTPSNLEGELIPRTPPFPALLLPEKGISINTWLVSELFDNTDPSGIEKDWIGESSVEPSLGVGKAKWKFFDDRLFSRNLDNYLDLYSFFKIKQKKEISEKVVYLHSYFYVAQETTVELRLGTDKLNTVFHNGKEYFSKQYATENELKLFLNGNNILIQKKSPSQRDGFSGLLALKPGWNRVLVKVANHSEGCFGAYAKIVGSQAASVTVSPEKSDALKISTQSMELVDKNELPYAYREWPYFGVDGFEFIKPDNEFSYQMCASFIREDNVPVADVYRLSGAGGKPPYQWKITAGSLPKGLVLDAVGVIAGAPEIGNDLGGYKFSLQLTDSAGKAAHHDFTMILKERPNKKFEQQKLLGLVEMCQAVPNGEHDKYLQVMKRIGYQAVVPTGFANGAAIYRYPNRFSTDDEDTMGAFQKAAIKNKIDFGFYMGNMHHAENHGYAGTILAFEDLLKNYHPKILWLDWAGWVPGGSTDAIFSMVKSFDPEIVVVRNGYPTYSNGDWDVLCWELFGETGDGYWNSTPCPMPWIKKYPMELWRHMSDPLWEYTKGINNNDPFNNLRHILSLIGEGYVADFDYAPAQVTGIKQPGGKLEKLSDSLFWGIYQSMADWASPTTGPSLIESYTNVELASLPSEEWGYQLVSLDRKTLYLHVMQNPWGKTGLKKSPTLELALSKLNVKEAIWMNKNQPISFKQNAGKVVFDLKNVVEDPVSTIIKIKLDNALPPYAGSVSGPKPFFDPARGDKSRELFKENLALRKPCKLLGGRDMVEVPPSNGKQKLMGNDGLISTRTAGAYFYDWTYEVDLLTVIKIRQVVVHMAEKSYSTDYQVTVSKDGKEWEVVGSGKPQQGGQFVHLFDPVEARYVRVTSLAPNGEGQVGGQMWVLELEVFSKAIYP